MREYSFQATEASVEALRRLRAPWVSAVATDRAVAITTADAAVVVLTVERADVEQALEASRLRADLVTGDDAHPEGAREVDVGDLGRGRNDVVVFAGECWTEGQPGDGDGRGTQSVQFDGRAGQRSDSAAVVCTTTDSIVVAASTGEGVLIRIGVRPATLEIVRDRLAIARFLVQRGYESGEDPR